MTGQPEFTLKSGEELSHSNQYGRSTQELEAFIRANPSRLYDQSQALLLISYNHMQLGDFANALVANEASLNIKAQLHADDLVNNYVRFGAIHLLRGNHHAALSYLLKAKDYPIEAIQLYAVIDGYLAAAYRGLGQFEQAETYYRQSIETMMIEYPANHPNIITSYYNLGKLYLEWGQPEMARQYFQRGLNSGGAASDRAFLQALLNNGMGEAYAEQPAQAESFHRKALDIATEFFGGYHRETALASLLLAESVYRQGRRDEARDAIQLAVRSLNPEQSNLSWNQLPDTSGLIIDRPLLARALGLRSRWLMDSALPDEQRLPLALANSEIAVHFLEAAMDDRMDQADRLELLPIARQAIAGGVQAGWQLGKNRNDQHALRRAFRLVEAFKVLQFRAHTGYSLQLTGTFPERERTMRRTLRLAELEFRLRPLDITVSQKVHRLRENYRLMKEDWKRSEPLGYQQRFGMDRRSLAERQSQLGADEVLLSYFIGDREAYVFALDRNRLEAFSIEGAGLAGAIEQFQSAIDSSDAAVLTAAGHQLYQRLVEPANAILKGKKKLSIVTDDAIGQLPFEALLTESYRKKRIRLHKLPYLIRDLSVEYRHTATSWKMPTGEASAAYEFLLVSPVFDQERLARIPVNRRILFDPNIHGASLMTDGQRFRPLTTSVAAADRLQVLWGQSPLEGRFKLREAATESLLKNEMGRAHYIHLGSYGFAEGPSPEEAGLVLANTDPTSTIADDGLLLASELQLNATSATDLLSLDFVEVGGAPDNKLHHILPLSGSLMLAGVSHVLYTESQENNPAFYPAFYEYLLDGNSISASLQEVKTSFAKDKDMAAPRYWARYRLLSK